MTRHCVAVNNRKWERQEDDRFCFKLLRWYLIVQHQQVAPPCGPM